MDNQYDSDANGEKTVANSQQQSASMPKSQPRSGHAIRARARAKLPDGVRARLAKEDLK